MVYALRRCVSVYITHETFQLKSINIFWYFFVQCYCLGFSHHKSPFNSLFTTPINFSWYFSRTPDFMFPLYGYTHTLFLFCVFGMYLSVHTLEFFVNLLFGKLSHSLNYSTVVTILQWIQQRKLKQPCLVCWKTKKQHGTQHREREMNMKNWCNQRYWMYDNKINWQLNSIQENSWTCV